MSNYIIQHDVKRKSRITYSQGSTHPRSQSKSTIFQTHQDLPILLKTSLKWNKGFKKVKHFMLRKLWITWLFIELTTLGATVRRWSVACGKKLRQSVHIRCWGNKYLCLFMYVSFASNQRFIIAKNSQKNMYKLLVATKLTYIGVTMTAYIGVTMTTTTMECQYQ